MAACDDCAHPSDLHRDGRCYGSRVDLVGRWAVSNLCSCNEYVPSPSTPGRDLVAVILALAVLAGVVWSVFQWGW